MDGTSPIGRKLRLGIVGVGNCASSLVQGISFYGENRLQRAPCRGSCTWSWGATASATSRWRRPSTSTPARSAMMSPTPSSPHPTTPTAFASPAPDRGRRAARPHARWGRQIRPRRHSGGRGARGRCGRGAAPFRRRGAGLLPAGGIPAGHRVLRRSRAEGRLRLRQLRAGVHRVGPQVARQVRGGGPAHRG